MVVDLKRLEKEVKKYKEKAKDKSNRGIESILNKKVVSKQILKSGKMEVRIPEYTAPSILGDTNRFFNKEIEETKRSLFFS